MDELFNQAAKMRYMFGGKTCIPMVLRMPAGAGFGKGLMISAIRDDNPVMYIEHKGLYGLEGEVPDGDYTVPIGKAAVAREGRDVSLLSWGAMVGKCLEAAAALEKEGLSAEVLDLRTITPLDAESVLATVKKTSRAVVVHEAVRTGGFGGEVAALIADQAFDYLDAPIKRVTAPDTPVPFSPPLEQEFIPSVPKILAAVKELF